MLTASSDLGVTTQQGDRQAQYWAFFTQDAVPCGFVKLLRLRCSSGGSDIHVMLATGFLWYC
jgi:hypothetical protein